MMFETVAVVVFGAGAVFFAWYVGGMFVFDECREVDREYHRGEGA